MSVRALANLPGGDPEPWAAITVRSLGKRFTLRHERPTSLSQELLAMFRGGATGEPFWAFRDVSFSVRRGQAVGVIGRNGSEIGRAHV